MIRINDITRANNLMPISKYLMKDNFFKQFKALAPLFKAFIFSLTSRQQRQQVTNTSWSVYIVDISCLTPVIIHIGAKIGCGWQLLHQQLNMYLQLLLLSLYLLEVEPLVVYSSGDIQLYSNGSSELSNNGGILQVYVNKWHDMDLFDEQWINVCSSDFNKGAAAAACRQLGYNDALNFGPYHEYNYQLNPNVSAYMMTGVACPVVSNYTKYGDNNLFRCSYFSTFTNDTSCTPVAVQCNTDRTNPSLPYNGQVILTNKTERFNRSIASGYLQMYINSSWYPVCANVSYFGASSACRQLGYTGVSAFYIDKSYNGPGLYIGEGACSIESEQCLSHCYNNTNAYQVINNCQLVHIVCRFNIEDAVLSSSGSQFLCELPAEQSINPTGNSCTTSSSSVGLSVSLGIFVTLTVIISILLVSLALWTLYCNKNRKLYSNIDDSKLIS